MLLEMRQKRVLIVEDDADLRRMFRTSLALAGYDVDEASDGVDALRIVEDRLPDLIVLDLVLRALDGISVQQELAARAVTRQIPIVIVTGSSIRTDALNVACVLHKPVMPDELVRTVQHCMIHGAPASGA
jgi:DNA-binding response OmpR family regulator